MNVVTNSFDAEQGMAGGASVNVQIKSGTNTLQRLGVRVPARTTSCAPATTSFPADQDKTKDNKNVFGGTIGGPIKRDKLFYFVSVESTVQRTIGGPYVTQASGSASQFLSLPTGGDPQRQLLGHRHGHLRSADRRRQRHGPRAVRLRQLSGITSTADPRFDACNFIPASRHQPGREEHPGATCRSRSLPGNANNYFAVPDYSSDFHKIDSKVTWNATNRPQS